MKKTYRKKGSASTFVIFDLRAASSACRIFRVFKNLSVSNSSWHKLKEQLTSLTNNHIQKYMWQLNTWTTIFRLVLSKENLPPLANIPNMPMQLAHTNDSPKAQIIFSSQISTTSWLLMGLKSVSFYSNSFGTESEFFHFIFICSKITINPASLKWV